MVARAKSSRGRNLLERLLSHMRWKWSCQGTVCSTPSKTMECRPRPLDHWLAQSFNAHTPVSSALPRNALQSLLITVNYQRPWLRASRDYKQLSLLFMRSLELLSNLDPISQHWIYIWRKDFLCQRKVEYLSNLHKEILNVTRNRKNVSVWTCRTRQDMFCDFINKNMQLLVAFSKQNMSLL